MNYDHTIRNYLGPVRGIALPLLAILFVVDASIVVAQPANDAKQQNSAAASTDELIRMIEQITLATLTFGETVRPQIDRSTFDQSELLNGLDFDDNEIASFVVEEIAFESYAGSLRGAHGTLLARAGNALDQSLLLATLLNEAGFDAVIR
jgi:hypothetical protein